MQRRDAAWGGSVPGGIDPPHTNSPARDESDTDRVRGTPTEQQEGNAMNALITYGGSHLSLGVLIGGPAFALTIAALVALGIWMVRHDWDSFDRGFAVFGGWASLAVACIVAIIAALGFYPYTGEYHHWQQVNGTVTSTNSRFLAAKGGADQKFVVTFAGSEQQFGCNDTRCATVSEGDDLTITCKRVFQWFGTPGYDCNFVSYKQASQ